MPCGSHPGKDAGRNIARNYHKHPDWSADQKVAAGINEAEEERKKKWKKRSRRMTKSMQEAIDILKSITE